MSRSLKSEVQSKGRGEAEGRRRRRMNFANPHFAEPRWLWLAVLAPLLLAGVAALFRPGRGGSNLRSSPRRSSSTT